MGDGVGGRVDLEGSDGAERVRASGVMFNTGSDRYVGTLAEHVSGVVLKCGGPSGLGLKEGVASKRKSIGGTGGVGPLSIRLGKGVALEFRSSLERVLEVEWNDDERLFWVRSETARDRSGLSDEVC
jgi:hypothetical protein